MNAREVRSMVEVMKEPKAARDREGKGRLCRDNEGIGEAEEQGCVRCHVKMQREGEAGVERRGKHRRCRRRGMTNIIDSDR